MPPRGKPAFPRSRSQAGTSWGPQGALEALIAIACIPGKSRNLAAPRADSIRPRFRLTSIPPNHPERAASFRLVSKAQTPACGYYCGKFFPMNSLSTELIWTRFENMTPGPKAASASSSCAFSLCTLEIASIADGSTFVLVERKQPDVWRWAIIGANGILLEEGFEPNLPYAKKAAAGAVQPVDAESLI